MTWDKLGKIKLLIVDDDEFNRQLVISLLFQISSIEFLEAEDGLEALSILTKTDIDMVLLDLHMPNLNGYDTLLAIKKEPKYKYIPVAILTTDEQEKRKLYTLGADDFLSKPYNLYELESRIYFHIENQQQEKLKNEAVSKKTRAISHRKSSNNIQTYSIALVEKHQKEFFYEVSKLAIQNEEDKRSVKVVAQLTKNLAELVGYGKKIANDISSASVIRNMGSLSSSKITPRLEYHFSTKSKREYKRYISASYRLLSLNIETEFMKISKKIIMQQREHFDGSGFPRQREGEQIHKVAYIVSLVETFHALLTQKDYYNNKIHSNIETYHILKSLSGQRLHPQITKLFLENFEYFIEAREKIISKNINKETIKYE
jgi:response regulator RpfG family c-di-GMP phosphodiesterase